MRGAAVGDQRQREVRRRGRRRTSHVSKQSPAVRAQSLSSRGSPAVQPVGPCARRIAATACTACMVSATLSSSAPPPVPTQLTALSGHARPDPRPSPVPGARPCQRTTSSETFPAPSHAQCQPTLTRSPHPARTIAGGREERRWRIVCRKPLASRQPVGPAQVDEHAGADGASLAACRTLTATSSPIYK